MQCVLDGGAYGVISIVNITHSNSSVNPKSAGQLAPPDSHRLV